MFICCLRAEDQSLGPCPPEEARANFCTLVQPLATGRTRIRQLYRSSHPIPASKLLFVIVLCCLLACLPAFDCDLVLYSLLDRDLSEKIVHDNDSNDAVMHKEFGIDSTLPDRGGANIISSSGHL